jgi:hypothetical protein
MKRIVLLVFISFTVLFAGSAVAEGCEDGTQAPPNAQEKAFFSKFTVLRAALPKPPAGWQYQDASKEKLAPDYNYIPEYLCGHSGYYIDLDMDYTRPMSEADSQKEMQAMQAKPDPAKQKELESLMAQQQDLIQKNMAAAQKQDYKTMDALGKQGDALNAKMAQVQADMNADQSAILAAVQKDREAKVRIAINDTSGASCYGSPKPMQVAGAIAFQCENPATYSSPGNQLDAPKGRILVVYGVAKIRTDDDWERKDDKGQEHKDSAITIDTQVDRKSMVVQSVTIDIEGDDLARAQSLYKQMNLAPLAALLKH